jgi:hypothetical protein
MTNPVPDSTKRPPLSRQRIDERARTLCIEARQPPENFATFLDAASAELRAEERGYDKTLADSFPASDPPANSGVTSDKDPVRTGEG